MTKDIRKQKTRISTGLEAGFWTLPDVVEHVGGIWGLDYKLEIQKTWIYGVRGECYRTMDRQVDSRYRASPADIADKLQQEAKALLNTPLQFYGIEMPEKATINVLGTNIKIGLMTFTQALQVALAPLLLLWLGSLYNTRYRETLIIGNAANLADIFPHSINVYPVGRLPELRKKSWAMYHMPKVIAFVYFAIRLAMLAVFVVPPVVAYLFSLYFLHSEQYIHLFLVLGALVFIFAFVTLFAEALPWHYWKTFPSPISRNR